jgi:hypothetical protein
VALDLYKIIDALLEERSRIDHIIRALESAAPPGKGLRSRQSDFSRAGRRGRKSMGSAERRVVAERMKRYWASRREALNAQGGSQSEPGEGAASKTGA